MSAWQLFGAAAATEGRKVRSARVAVVTAVMLDVGIALICAGAQLATRSGDPTMVAKLGPVVARGGWLGFLAGGLQITAVAGLLGFGVVLAWLFGREFTEGTVTGLFALPVGRATIAAAKLVVYVGWAVLVSTALVVTFLVLGLVTGLGAPDAQAMALLGRVYGVALLTAGLAIPAAWAATLGRGLLAGIATMIAIVVLAQISVIGGFGGWFPFAAPGLWAASTGVDVTAGSAMSVTPAQLAMVIPVAAVFATCTLISWRRLELNR